MNDSVSGIYECIDKFPWMLTGGRSIAIVTLEGCDNGNEIAIRIAGNSVDDKFMVGGNYKVDIWNVYGNGQDIPQKEDN